MSLFDLIQTASANMLRNKARTILTIIAIFIGAMTITLTNGIGSGVKSYINNQIGNLGATNILEIQVKDTSAKGPSSGPTVYDPKQKVQAGSGAGPRDHQLIMTDADVNTIKSIPNIESVEPVRPISPDYIMGTGNKYQVALSEQYGPTTAPMLAGQGVDNSSTQNQITIPESFVSPLGYSSKQAIIGMPVTIAITSAEGKQSTVTAYVVGVQQKTVIGGTVSYINKPLTTSLFAIQSKGLPPATINLFTVVEATFPTTLTDAQITTLKNDLDSKGYSGQTIKDAENTIFTAINAIIIVFDMFGAIALLAATFGIINTLFMAVQERTKEIGLMKALGMGRKRIFVLFSIEAVLIGFWGSALGVLFASLIGKIINHIGANGFLKNFPGLSLLTFPLKTVIIVIVGIMLIAFLAGTLPALRASRKDPIDALRYE